MSRWKPEIRLAVATCGENFSWIARTGLPAAIYDATGSRDGCIHVPNAAREAGQYLRHIVGNYGRFADWEIFLQGNPFAHCHDLLPRLDGRDFLRRHLTPLGGTQAYIAGHPHLHSRWADRFARAILGSIPDGQPWCRGAQFAVSGPALMRRPLEWWRGLLRKTLAESHTSPWALERLWLVILSDPLQESGPRT